MTDEVTTGTAETTNDAAATSTTTATSTTSTTTATAAVTEGQASTTEQSEAKPEGAPEAYEFTAPEGKQFSPEMLAAFSDAARELNLPQESAQKVLDKIAPALAAKQESALSAARQQWGADVRADAEIGGTDFEAKLAVANKAFTEFGTPELRTLLDTTGLGDHPELIRWAHRVGKAISDDGFIAGRGASAPNVDPAKRLFPNQA